MHRHLCGERVQSFHQILKGRPEPREYQVLRCSEERANVVLVETPLCAYEGKEGERRGPRHNQSVQTAQLHRQRSDTPSGRARTTGQRSRENASSQRETQENVCTLTCPTKTRKSALGKAGWTLHLNYSVIKTSNSQGRQEKIHALTHKVA